MKSEISPFGKSIFPPKYTLTFNLKKILPKIVVNTLYHKHIKYDIVSLTLDTRCVIDEAIGERAASGVA